jgi:hypothetical protein
MQNEVWIDLIRRVPPEFLNQLVLVTDSKAEIAIEMLFRLEPDFAVLRGRLGGTTEGGQLFMVPYDRLTAIVLTREMKEAEVDQLFPPANAEKETVHGSVETTETEQDIEITPPKPQSALIEPAPAKTTVPTRASTESQIAARNSLLDRLKAARQVTTGR